ncbi:MAG: type II toxin-antitoxin system VapC family toxin [Gemmatimonadetes bacterium]|nr:PIN domain-containing protein [Gemmatimonadota bacterium]MDE2677711.1 PIN domain-containing protein [Gemmatimonadota bacterium]MXX33541.1 type II toxin-antitoxin system VapC family toxin [Gemmatimonadota bacterium]MYD12019.1 type II toxin-antitoxin system VapC family toxin [Gemmatimonadota bacterium]MYI64928.1 type II toxin-antitoxin system VapC family toxin [Gemmatimonadota bacterium]
MIAIDTNVLVYAHREETGLHAVAGRVLVAMAEGATRWGLPVFCIGEFIRVVTHRRVFSPPSTLSQATGFLTDVIASPSCRIVRPGPEFTSLLVETVLRTGARGNLVFDAQIVALCREHGIATILTNDRDFERFHDLSVRVLE